MASNNFASRSDSALLQVANQAYTTINDDPIGYGVQAGQLTALNGGRTALEASIDGLTAAKAALAAATQARNAARATTLDALGSLGATIYNAPGVTNEMLAAAGYAIHDSTKTPVLPVTVSNVVAVPYSNGTVQLKWSRNGNPYGVQFAVEVRTADGEWEWVSSPTRTRITLTGITPGVTRYCRVIAFKNGIYAIPSEPVVVYPSEGEEALAVAA
ncbi:MAG TPA: fibronectin type III domain-containing protein [Fimbriimonadaceae bacterium]|nr:fibronectin type III domain-containing protein [Fimbriimonadaceae bacterium]HRJ97834.1 fibronectin type III domain-containing protein [Fimbriimonadaceae bacterium]